MPGITKKAYSAKRRNKFYYILTLIFFAFISLIPLFGTPNIFSYHFIGSADFISLIDINNNIFDHFFIYSPYLYGGINTAYLIALLFPEYVLYYIGNSIHLTPLVVTLIYISLIIFTAEVSMYNYLTYLTSTKLESSSTKSKGLAILFSVIYAYAPSFATLMPPGHFIEAIPYVLFPLFLIQIDKLFLTQNVGKKPYVIIYLIFLLSARSFSNVGIVYTLLLTLFIYVFLAWIIQRIQIKKLIKETAIILFLLFIATVWWVLSFATTLHDLYGASAQDYYINTAIDAAVLRANVMSILLGMPDNQLYLLNTNYYVNPAAAISFGVIAFFFLYGVIRFIKNRYVTILTVMSVIGIFLTKGPQEPFSSFYMWLYNNFIGFQSFRRPVSKYWGMFMIFYLVLSFIGVIALNKRLEKTKYYLLIYLFFILVAGYYIFAFTVSATLTPFNIPNYYYTARDDLTRSNADKILLLPGTYGLQPVFNNSINNLYASDFLYYIWDFALVAPDATASTPDEPEKKQVNDLVRVMLKKQNVCTQLKQIGISQIMVRQDLSSDEKTEESVSHVLSVLNYSPYIASKKIYSDDHQVGFTFYTVKNQCRSNVVTLAQNGSQNVSLSYTIQNPTRINIEIKNLKSSTSLIFLNNFRTNWKLYPVTFSSDFIDNKNKNRNSFLTEKDLFNTEELSSPWKKSIPESDQSVAYGYANKWLINRGEIKRDFPEDYTTNKDGSINVQFVLYYNNQAFVLYGFIIFFISLACGAMYCLLLLNRKLVKRVY